LVLSSNPGTITAEIAIPLPHPRNRQEPQFQELVDEIYSVLTKRKVQTVTPGADAIAQVLPSATADAIGGMIEAITAPPHRNKADFPELARILNFEVDDLFPVAEALSILHFAEINDGELTLTASGERFVQLDSDERKALFAEQLLRFVPLAAHIWTVLSKREEHRAPRSRFEDELEDHLSHEVADSTLNSVITWGRYAELFTYNSRSRTFANPRPSGVTPASNEAHPAAHLDGD
jgi:NitT/TauT family transport system ATP-binding protein